MDLIKLMPNYWHADHSLAQPGHYNGPYMHQASCLTVVVDKRMRQFMVFVHVGADAILDSSDK